VYEAHSREDCKQVRRQPYTEAGKSLALALSAMAELVQEYSDDSGNSNVSAWLRSGAIEQVRKAEDEARREALGLAVQP
jgi:hypothetical protein